MPEFDSWFDTVIASNDKEVRLRMLRIWDRLLEAGINEDTIPRILNAVGEAFLHYSPQI